MENFYIIFIRQYMFTIAVCVFAMFMVSFNIATLHCLLEESGVQKE